MPEGTFLEVLASAGFEHTPASPEFLSWLAEVKAPQEVVNLLAAGLPAVRNVNVAWVNASTCSGRTRS